MLGRWVWTSVEGEGEGVGVGREEVCFGGILCASAPLRFLHSCTSLHAKFKMYMVLLFSRGKMVRLLHVLEVHSEELVSLCT